MFCKKCGNQLNDGATFCNKCGFSMNQNDSTTSTQVSSFGSSATATMVKAATQKNKKAILIIVALVVVGLAICGVLAKQKADNAAAIYSTIQSYSKAISTLDFERADTFCEPEFASGMSDLLKDIPYGNSISGLISSIAGATEAIKFSITPNGKLEIKKDVATIPVQVKLSIAEQILGEKVSYNGEGNIILAKIDGKWLIRDMEAIE